MPHGREELRTQQRHVRLGFGDGQVLDWMHDAGLNGVVAAQLPAEGGFTSAEVMASQIGWLLSDAAENITGIVLSSDGGYVLG